MTHDFVNTVTPEQMRLHAAMRRDQWPEAEDIIIERRWPLWLALPAAMLAGAAMWLGILWALGWLAVANASEPPRRWVIWDAATNKQFHPHQFTSATACNTDIGGIKDDGGKRLSCVRIDQRKGE